MLPDFAFATATRILFGRGQANATVANVAVPKRRVLAKCSRKLQQRSDPIQETR